MEYQVVEQYVRTRTCNEKGWFMDFGHRICHTFNNLTEARRYAQSIVHLRDSKDITIYIVDMTTSNFKTIEAYYIYGGVKQVV